MTKKILELTEKIYNEGVEKAKKEAELIIVNAKKEADNIIATAKHKEEEIVETAKKQAAEIKKNSDTEIRLAARQFVSELKQQIAGLIVTEQTESSVKQAFEDDSFVKNMILTIIENWNPQKPEELDINLLLPAKEEKMFMDFFMQKAKKTLESGLEINFKPNMQSGFRIGPKDGSYHISFTDKDFENYFKDYLKPKTKKMLFE